MGNVSLSIRKFVKANLGTLVEKVNAALSSGECLHKLEKHVAAVSPKGAAPAWFDHLKRSGGLGRTDGKSVGSAMETLFSAVLRSALPEKLAGSISVKAERGVDLPGAGIGIKAPSENLCTSEPFFSPYQRLLGHAHDSVVLLTDYQDKKNTLPLRLQVTRASYFTGSEQADGNLCDLARKWREILKDDRTAFRKVVRFLAYSNQSDEKTRSLLRELRRHPGGSGALSLVKRANQAAEDWRNGSAHWPSDREWDKILAARLDGRCGMSDARQWRHRYPLDSLCPV